MKYLQLWLISGIVLFQANVKAQSFDVAFLKSINHDESSFKTKFFSADEKTVMLFNIGAPATMMVAGIFSNDKQLRKNALYMAGGFVFNTLATNSIKMLTERQRPCDKYEFIVKRSNNSGYSFPSGHTSGAFYLATSFSLLYPKWYVIVPANLWAASVGYARMYQGVHFPTDVFAGALLGAGSAWVTHSFKKMMDKRATRRQLARQPVM